MIRLAIRVPGESAELVLAELAELSPGGVEECDGGDGFVEYAIYTIPTLLAHQLGIGLVSSGGIDDLGHHWPSTRERPRFIESHDVDA